MTYFKEHSNFWQSVWYRSSTKLSLFNLKLWKQFPISLNDGNDVIFWPWWWTDKLSRFFVFILITSSKAKKLWFCCSNYNVSKSLIAFRMFVVEVSYTCYLTLGKYKMKFKLLRVFEFYYSTATKLQYQIQDALSPCSLMQMLRIIANVFKTHKHFVWNIRFLTRVLTFIKK